MTHSLISDSLAGIVAEAQTEDGVTLEECVEFLGPNSILLMILLFSIPTSFPLTGIPGFSAFTGIPITVMGFQIMTSHERIWLPRRIASYRVRSKKLLAVMERSVPMLRAIEKRLCRRLVALSYAPWRNLCGAMFFMFGVVLILPIPFFNMPIGIASTLLAIGLIERDGVIILISLITSLVVGVACVMFVQQGWATISSWF